MQAIADLVRMDHDNGLLSRDIAAVDMRLSDRLVVAADAGSGDAARGRAQ